MIGWLAAFVRCVVRDAQILAPNILPRIRIGQMEGTLEFHARFDAAFEEAILQKPTGLGAFNAVGKLW